MRGRLEGWPQARSGLWPSFETRASFDKLRSALLRTRLMETIARRNSGESSTAPLSPLGSGCGHSPVRIAQGSGAGFSDATDHAGRAVSGCRAGRRAGTHPDRALARLAWAIG